MTGIGWALFLAASGTATAFAYAVYRIQRRPSPPPPAREPARTVLCLGDSLTHGTISHDYVAELARERAGRGYRFVNAGVNGDLAWNALQRLERLIAAGERPAWAVVLVGTNDAIASLNERNAAGYRRAKRLPRDPDLGWFVECYRAILDRLAASGARVAVASLPPAAGPATSPLNERLAAYSRAVEGLARERGLRYLPVLEAQRDWLASHPESPDAPGARRDYRSERFSRALLAGLLRYLAGWSLERVSRRMGSALTSDGLHLNARGGELLRREVARFLEEETA
jgi:lysophospholipase L1-like esterase